MKWTYVLGVIVLTAVLSIGSTFLIMEKSYEKEESERADDELVSTSKEKENEEEFVSIVDTSSGLGWEGVTFSKKIDEWKSGDEPFPDSLVEDVIQMMSHQKVIAELKEGSIMITPERIDTLIRMIEENKDKYPR